LSQRLLHRLFKLGVLMKGIDGLLETAGGVLFLCLSRGSLTRIVFALTREELLEDPDDWFATTLRHAFTHLTAGNKIFAAAYLIGHGLMKLVLVFGLWREKLWSFPVAFVVLVGFIGYQVFRLVHQFSFGLIALTVIDAGIVGLIWNEYRSVRSKDAGLIGKATG
jgi:uncharacterized membrane protein